MSRRISIYAGEPVERLLGARPDQTASQALNLAALTLLEGPRCTVHGRALLCPACNGSKGGARRTPAQQRATRAATRARREKARARRESKM